MRSIEHGLSGLPGMDMRRQPQPKPKPTGEVVADKSILPDMMDVVRRLCGASVPFTIELFCGGVLGAVLRGARRMVAAQPTTDLEEEIAGFVFYEGVPAVVEAFSRAVPQARTPPVKPPAGVS